MDKFNKNSIKKKTIKQFFNQKNKTKNKNNNNKIIK